MYQLGTNQMDFRETWYCRFLLKSVQINPSFVKIGQKYRALYITPKYVSFHFTGDPLYVGMDLTIASFDSISEVNMVSNIMSKYIHL
jgi:hypothetical protein